MLSISEKTSMEKLERVSGGRVAFGGRLAAEEDSWRGLCT